jgi:hypothetical protein
MVKSTISVISAFIAYRHPQQPWNSIRFAAQLSKIGNTVENDRPPISNLAGFFLAYDMFV